MIKLFLGNKVIVLLLLPLYLVMYQCLNYFYPFYETGVPSNFGFWTEYIYLNSMSSTIGASFFVLINSYGLNALVNRNKFLERNTYLIALLYIVLMSLFHSAYYLNGILITHFMLILMTHQFFELNRHEDGRKTIFNSFFYAGIASTFSPILILSFPILILPILIMRPFKLREIVVSVLGYIIPFIYLVSLAYLFNDSIELNFAEQHLAQSENKDYLFVIATICILLVLGTLAVLAKSQKTTINSNKQFRILFILTLIFAICALYYIISFQQLDQLSLMLIPLSIFLIFSFLSKTYGIAATVLFYVVFGYTVIKFFLFLPNQNL